MALRSVKGFMSFTVASKLMTRIIDYCLVFTDWVGLS